MLPRVVNRTVSDLVGLCAASTPRSMPPNALLGGVEWPCAIKPKRSCRAITLMTVVAFIAHRYGREMWPTRSSKMRLVTRVGATWGATCRSCAICSTLFGGGDLLREDVDREYGWCHQTVVATPSLENRATPLILAAWAWATWAHNEPPNDQCLGHHLLRRRFGRIRRELRMEAVGKHPTPAKRRYTGRSVHRRHLLGNSHAVHRPAWHLHPLKS